jgi:hypothetical protein
MTSKIFYFKNILCVFLELLIQYHEKINILQKLTNLEILELRNYEIVKKE